MIWVYFWILATCKSWCLPDGWVVMRGPGGRGTWSSCPENGLGVALSAQRGEVEARSFTLPVPMRAKVLLFARLWQKWPFHILGRSERRRMEEFGFPKPLARHWGHGSEQGWPGQHSGAHVLWKTGDRRPPAWHMEKQHMEKQHPPPQAGRVLGPGSGDHVTYRARGPL